MQRLYKKVLLVCPSWSYNGIEDNYIFNNIYAILRAIFNNIGYTTIKLHYKGEPYRFGGYRDPSVHTDLLLLYKDTALDFCERPN